MRIEQLQDISRRLSALVSDPQPGYIGWCEALGRVGSEFVAGWMEGKTSRAVGVLSQFANTVERAGGIVRHPDGTSGLVCDEDWLDLADVYESACEVLGREPLVGEDRSECVDGDEE